MSPRRWCLTGTPIQNRIEDLTSLLKFLHFEPFAQSHAFMRYILDPLSKDTPNRTFSLQALLHTICLRRTEKLLDLPTPHFEKIVVRMCTEETSLYSEIVKKCARDVDEVVSTKKKKIKKYNVLFTAMMRLRRLCNHGTFPVCVPASTSSPSTSKIDAELECDFCQGNDEDKIELVGMEEFCIQCGKSLDPATRRGNIAATPESDYSMPEPLRTPASCSGLQSTPPLSVSTKLQTVVNVIENLQLGSKRQVPIISSCLVAELTPIIVVSFFRIGQQHSTC